MVFLLDDLKNEQTSVFPFLTYIISSFNELVTSPRLLAMTSIRRVFQTKKQKFIKNIPSL